MSETALLALNEFCAAVVCNAVPATSPLQEQGDERLLFWRFGKRLIRKMDWTPSTDPAEAMVVLAKCAQKRAEAWDIHRPDATLVIHAPHPVWDNKWVIMSDAEGTIIATGETLPLAICKFAKEIFSK